MLLTETIKRSTSTIQMRRTAQENQQSAANYMRALGQLAQASEDLKTALNCAAEMKARGLVEQPLLTQQIRDSLMDSVNDCGRGIYDGKLTGDMVKVLKTRGESFINQMQNRWREAAVQYSEGARGYLSLIGELSDDPVRAKKLTESMEKAVSTPVTLEEIHSLMADVAEAKEITDAFSISPGVEIFLKKVSAQRATVFDLTPDILAWLKEKNLTSKLKVKF